MEKQRYCLWCSSPLSTFEHGKKQYHGSRRVKGTCAWKNRRKKQNELLAKSPEVRKRKAAQAKEWRKTHPDTRPKSYFREYYRDKYAVEGGMRSEKRVAASRRNIKKATAERIKIQRK